MMVIANSEEIAKAMELAKTVEGTTIPEQEIDYTDFLFDANDVSFSYIDTNGGIRIMHSSQDLSLEYDEDLFNSLQDNFAKRDNK